MIGLLKRLMGIMAADGFDTATHMQAFFDVGEWMLAFEYPWFEGQKNPDADFLKSPEYVALETYFEPFIQAYEKPFTKS